MTLLAVVALTLPWPMVVTPSAGVQAIGSSSVEDSIQVRDLFGGEHKASIRLDQFALEDGLPSLNINALVMAPDGLLWVGTGSGCVTFDGDRFRPVGPERDRLYDLQGRDVTEVTQVADIAVDGWGHVWVAGRNGQLLRYATEQTVPSIVATEQRRITCLTTDGQGHVWIGGSGLERAEVTDDGVRLTKWLGAPVDGTERGNLRIVSIVETPPKRATNSGVQDAERPVFIATTWGLYRWTASGGLRQIDDSPRDAIFFDTEGCRWDLLPDGQFLIDGEPKLRWPEPLGELNSVEHLPDGKTLLAFDDILLAHVPKTDQIRRVRLSGSPGAVLADGASGIWIAPEPLGLEYFAPRRYHTLRSGLPRIHTDALATLGPGTLLVASRSLARSALIRTNTVPLHAAEPERVRSTEHLDGVYGAALGRDGFRYVATRQGVALLEDLEKGSDRMAAFDGKFVSTIVAGQGDSVWVGVEDGLHELSGGEATGLSFLQLGENLTALEAAPDAILGAAGGRVLRFDCASGETIELLDLDGPMIRDMHLDTRGDLWLTTFGPGLYRLRNLASDEESELDHWGTQQGLPDRFLGWVGTVPGPTEDSHVWVNSNRGVFAMSRESLELARSHPGERVESWLMNSPESNGAGGVALESGHIAVPTMAGICVIDTNQPLAHSEAPALSLSGVWANGKEIDGSPPLVGPTDLDFEFEAASFPRARGAVVDYRLEGHDRSWRHAGSERAARYVNLPPGEYQFHLRGRAKGARSGAELASQWIRIEPHWHQRLTVRLLLAALLLSSTFAIVRQWISGNNAQRRALQLEVESQQRIAALRRQLSDAEENERARIARELHDDLAQRLAAVALAVGSLETPTGPTEMASSALEEGSSPGLIQSIQDSIRELAHDVHWLSRRLHPTVLDDLGLTAALRSECARRAARVPFSIDFEDDGSAKDLKGEAGLAVFRIVQEALQNVANHADATVAIVRLHTEGEHLVLEIEDDGCGMSNEDRSGPGIGLASMSERAKLVGGELTILSAEIGGLLVRVTLPGDLTG